MNHCVLNFQELEDDFSIASSSGFSRSRKPSVGQEEIMELLWQNGPVVAQAPKFSRRTPVGVDGGEVVIPAEQSETQPSGVEETAQQHLFMQEDEMASWLQYPLDVSPFDRDVYSDLLYSAPSPSAPITTAAPSRPVSEIRPQPMAQRPPPTFPQDPQRLQNFLHMSRINPTRAAVNFPGQSAPSIAPAAAVVVRASTVVESNETPATGPKSRVSHTIEDCKPDILIADVRGTATDGGEFTAGIPSSPSCSGGSFGTCFDRRPPPQKPTTETAADNRKRKGREVEDHVYQTEDTEIEATDCKKRTSGSTSTKKSRAAEVHNLSERRRRDGINEKMRALQELIPRCNKSDKASMLDEAIEYLKSLQLQVQMMSMGCGMVPMMYPGVQQYQYMPMMGMGMSMDLSMNRPMVQFPSMLPGSALTNPAAASNMTPCFPMPAFHMQPVPVPVPVPDSSRIQATNQADSMPNSAFAHNPNQAGMPNSTPCQQFFGLHQNQSTVQLNSKQPISSKEIGNKENNQYG